MAVRTLYIYNQGQIEIVKKRNMLVKRERPMKRKLNYRVYFIDVIVVVVPDHICVFLGQIKFYI